MTLDADLPEPPDLTNRGTPSDFRSVEETGGTEEFRREEPEAVLRDGAWREGFEEWGEYTDLDETEVGAIADAGLFQSLDFYWDPDDETLRYDAPSVPDDWRERAPETLSSTSEASRVESELDDLGRTVLEILHDTYLDWSEEASDYVWSGDVRSEPGVTLRTSSPSARIATTRFSRDPFPDRRRTCPASQSRTRRRWAFVSG